MSHTAEIFDGEDAPTPLTAEERRELARVERQRDAAQLAKAAATAGKGRAPAVIDLAHAAMRPDYSANFGKRVLSGPVSQPGYEQNISLDPRVVDHLLPRNAKNELEHADVLASLRAAFDSAFSGLASVAKARAAAAANEAWTPAQATIQVGGMAEKTLERVTQAFDKANKFLGDFAAGLEKSLSAPLEGGTRDQLAIEIREYVKNLPEAKRAPFVSEALKRNDTRTLQAVLGAPAFLSGLNESHHTGLTRQYREASNPAASARLAIAKKGLELLDARGGLIFTEIEKALGASFAKLNKLRAANSAAEAALVMQSGLE